MRLALGISLAVLIAARGDLARADPTAPQVNPARLQQEDNRRIDAQQRQLEHDRDPGSAGGAAGNSESAAESAAAAARELEPATARRLRVASFVLFGVAGAGAIASVPLFIRDAHEPAHGSETAGTWARVLAISAAGAAGAGFTLFMASRPRVQVAPVVSASTFGLTVVGQL